MKNERIEYAWFKALTDGLSLAIVFTLFDILYYRARGIFLFKKIIFNFCLFIILYFIYGYFGYKRYLKRIEKLNKILGPKEFRCFKCESIIRPEENKCSNCGWMWK